MRAIIKDKKLYRLNKRRIITFDAEHNSNISAFMKAITNDRIPMGVDTVYIQFGMSNYIDLVNDLTALIKTNYIIPITPEIFMTVKPIGDKGGMTVKAEEYIYKLSDEKKKALYLTDNLNSRFVFDITSLIYLIESDTTPNTSMKDYIYELYLKNIFKSEKELYEEEKLKEEQADCHISNKYEGTCSCCGTAFSIILDGFAPSCPNCGAKLDIFDKID